MASCVRSFVWTFRRNVPTNLRADIPAGCPYLKICPSIVRNSQPFGRVTIVTAPAVRV
jgi:hypothetical protein